MSEPDRREYAAGNVVVSFDASRCIHVGRCLKGLPAVFNLEARPWIQPANASVSDIIDVVGRCPSGALQWRTTDGSFADPVRAETPSITIRPNGSLLVRGPVEIRGDDGRPLDAGARAALCRCGMSGNKPYCDNSHARNGWRDNAASA